MFVIAYPAEVIKRFGLSESDPFPVAGVGEWTALYSTNEKAFTAFGFVGMAPSEDFYDPGYSLFGKDIFIRYNCNTCHAVTDGEDEGAVGPSLYAWAGTARALEGGGTEIADTPYLKMSVLRPSATVASGYSTPMPSYEGQIAPYQLDALWGYVANLSDAVPRERSPESTAVIDVTE